MSDRQERLENISREVRRETLAVYKVLGPGHPEDVYLRFLERGVWDRRRPGSEDPGPSARTGLAYRLARLFGLESGDS